MNAHWPFWVCLFLILLCLILPDAFVSRGYYFLSGPAMSKNLATIKLLGDVTRHWPLSDRLDTVTSLFFSGVEAGCYKRWRKRKAFFPQSSSLPWWRITDSNRWPLECKSSALSAELIPLIINLEIWKFEDLKMTIISKFPNQHIFKSTVFCRPDQSWTGDLYIISVAL